MKKAFTLIEMVIVLLIIGILMAATMRFWWNRIVDLKAQSIKEQFVWHYNDLYSQNMTSSFRNAQKYDTLMLVFTTGMIYRLDDGPLMNNLTLPNLELKNLRFWVEEISFPMANLLFIPYHLWCSINNGPHTWNVLYFDLIIPENGKQYCFEIISQTCKLVETKCNE